MSTSLCAVYDFRANRDTYELSQITDWLKRNAKKWCFQLERGDTGYEHWQGRFSLMKKRRKHELMALMQGTGFVVPNYLEPTVGTNTLTLFYVLKEDTRIDGPWKDTDVEKYIPRQYRGMEETLRPFQKDILESARCFEPRKINVVVDITGDHGKSVVTALSELHHRGIDLPPCNDGEKLISSTCDLLMAKKERSPPIMFMDIPRGMDQRRLNGMFTALEQIKKGKVFDMRYHYKEWWFDSPQIWVFMNEAPSLRYLSRDRWLLWTINKAHELVEFFPGDDAEDLDV